jgi:hypothetical protein
MYKSATRCGAPETGSGDSAWCSATVETHGCGRGGCANRGVGAVANLATRDGPVVKRATIGVVQAMLAVALGVARQAHNGHDELTRGRGRTAEGWQALLRGSVRCGFGGRPWW